MQPLLDSLTPSPIGEPAPAISRNRDWHDSR